MASWADVRTIASTLPETSEGVEAWLARAPKRLAQAYLSASQ